MTPRSPGALGGPRASGNVAASPLQPSMVAHLSAQGGDDNGDKTPHPERYTEVLTIKVSQSMHDAVTALSSQTRVPYSALLRDVIAAHLEAIKIPRKRAAARPSASPWRKQSAVPR